MRRIALSKKGIAIAAASFLLLAAAGLFWHIHTRTPGSVYVSTCSTYTGTYDLWGTNGIKAVSDKYSKAIVVATVDDPKALSDSTHPDDPAPRITITQVIKGANELHEDDAIPICPGLGHVNLPQGEHPTVLVFLDGKDGNRWVPTFGVSGIMPGLITV